MQLAISGVTVRLVFRVLFTALFFYIGILGSICNGLAKKRQLLRNGRIRVSEATGWLGLVDLALGVWNLRTIPNVRWWLLMALIAILSKLTDFATSVVHQAHVQGTCDFGTGMVLTTLPVNGTGDYFGIPPFNGRPALVSGNAQLTSLANQCKQGIYSKVNSDPSFCATEYDLLGAWECVPVGNDITYAFQQFTAEQILGDLAGKQLLDAPNIYSINTNSSSKYAFSHLVAWSTPTFDGSGEVWSVKASVDLTPFNTDDKIMHNMHCVMDAAEAEVINAMIPSASTLQTWVPNFQGYMYNGFESPAVDDVEGTLAWYLNTIIMVAGSSDFLLSRAPLDDPTQGCLVWVTIVPWWLIALLFLTVLVGLVGSAVWLILWLQVRRHSRSALVKHAPLDLWTWMAQAVLESRETAGNRTPAVLPKQVDKWDIEIENAYGVRIEQHEAELQSLTVANSGPKRWNTM